MFTKKISVLIFVAAYFYGAPFAIADHAGSTETILNWAEKAYPQYFPNHEATKVLVPWLYRYYSATGIYAGLNDNGGVYVMGGAFGQSPLYIDTEANLLNLALANHAPVASSLSVEANPAVSLVETKLIGSDSDNDTISYLLLSPSVGQGYSEAYVAPQSGRLYVTLDGSNTVEVNLTYRVSDGQLFSAAANVKIQLNANVQDKQTGANNIAPEVYGGFPINDPYGNLLGGSQLPASVDLSSNFPTPGDQGQQGSCVAWATGYALKSYQEKVELRWDLNRLEHLFSPAFIFNQIHDRSLSCREGSLIFDALNLLKNTGAATWSNMPYTDANCTTAPTSVAVQQAAGFKISSWAKLNGVDAIKAELANHHAVVIGVDTYESLQLLHGTNSVYTAKTGAYKGGHALAVVGYDDNKYGGAFRIINSWGTSWGDNGYFWLTYDLARQGVIREAYSAVDASDTNNPQPVDPPPQPANMPNLTVTSWKADYTPKPSGSGTFQYKITNTGTAEAPAGAYVNLMLSKDRAISNSDIYVAYEKIPFSLEPGIAAYRDDSNVMNFKFPDTLLPGSYYMAVWVDDLSKVAESNENDNVSFGDSQLTIINSLPDLMIQNWYAEWDDYGRGTFSYEVINKGNSQAPGGWDVNLLPSSDATLGNDDYLYLFYKTIHTSLSPGVYISENEYFDFADVPPGYYYMAVWIDDLNMVSESNERNNISWGWDWIYWGFGSLGTPSAQSDGITTNKALDSGLTTGGGKMFNGKKLLPDGVSMKKVEVVATPGGGFQIVPLADEQTNQSGLTGKTTPKANAQDETIFLKTMKSKDIGVFPTTKEIPMP